MVKISEIVNSLAVPSTEDRYLIDDISAEETKYITHGMLNGLYTLKVNSVAVLRTTEPSYDKQIITLLGHTTSGLGGGDFRADFSDATTADDDGATIVTNGGKRWKRVTSFNFSVKDFGAFGDNSTDDKLAIQKAEDFLNAIYLVSGVKQTLYFPSGSYEITGKLFKKSGVVWKGVGKIKRADNDNPTGAGFSLIVCQNIMDFSIGDITLENCPHDFVSNGVITRNSGLGNENSCIDIQNCTDFDILNVKMKSYSLGIRLSGCFRYRVTKNDFKANNSKTLESIQNSTFTNFPSYQQTGAINQGSYGTIATSATGNLTNGSPIITNVSTFTGYFVGQYIQPRVSGVGTLGYEIPAKIIAINTGNSTITLDRNSGATLMGVTVQRPANLFPTNENYIISENIVDNVGLDTAIFGINQTYDQARGSIKNNIIIGGNTGIAVYRGTFFDPSEFTPTYAGNLLVSDNIINWTTENGYYQRGVIGCQVLGNKVYRCGTRGAIGNSSSGAYVFRVNPFDNGAETLNTYINAYYDNVSNDHLTICANNQAIDHGTVDTADDAVILIEHDNIICHNNTITRSEEFSKNKTGVAISIGNGKAIKNVNVYGNSIIGNFELGIQYFDALKKARLTDYAKIENNTLGGKYNTGISIDSYTFNNIVKNNTIVGDVVTSFITIKNSPFSVIEHNKLYGNSASGVITIASGCLSSDMPYYLSGGSVSRAIRRGGNLKVIDNDIKGTYVTAFAKTETSGVDDNFSGRCKEFKNNYLNGVLFVDERVGGTPASTFTSKTWQKHDFVPNSNIAVGQPSGKLCISSGGYGSTTVTTGNVTNTSKLITNVVNMDGYGMGLFITPSSGFSTPALITSIKTTFEVSKGDITDGSNIISNVNDLNGFYVGMTITISNGFASPSIITGISINNRTITVTDNANTNGTVSFNVSSHTIAVNNASTTTATDVILNLPTPIFASTANLV